MISTLTLMHRAPVIHVLMALLSLWITGCQSLGGLRSYPGVTESELARIPRSPDLPVVIVVPQRVSWRLSTANSQEIITSEEFLTAMLVSALGRHGNIRLLDPSLARTIARPEKGQRGPFQVRVILTEIDPFSTIHDSGFDPWRYDSSIDYLWKPPITILGFWVSVLTGLPSVYLTTEIKGVVGIDVEAIDMKTNTVATSFPVHGTHMEASRQVGNPLFGAYIKTEARSTSSGASRVALNEAVEKLYQKLAGLGG